MVRRYLADTRVDPAARQQECHLPATISDRLRALGSSSFTANMLLVNLPTLGSFESVTLQVERQFKPERADAHVANQKMTTVSAS